INVSSGLFPYLQGSKTEADSIINKLAQVDDGKEYRSSEKFLKDSLANYGLVHLSTHGYSLKVNIGKLPVSQSDSLKIDNTLLASGIVLQGANVAGRDGEKEDGLLSARELCDMEGLEGVDLVVLSACQTAQGVVADEGPTGIVRGLKKAGAQSVMASLWPVNDEATALFMEAFYNALLKPGITKYDALREAQDAVKNYTIKIAPMRFNTKTLSHRPITEDRSERTEFKPYKEPYYWAPFILIDDISYQILKKIILMI
ncbi:MAG: CHAT domain-containing protein, partial [Prevotella sp.]|nr:CHAT domain-containing protein [Prevotella sp.]